MRQQGHSQAEGEKAKQGKVERLLERCISVPKLLAFVFLTSLFDASLVVACGTCEAEEQNPVGKMLIRHHGQWGLFYTKMAGTVAVILIVWFLYKKWRPAAQLVVGVLALLQLLLMFYLFC